MYDLVADAGVVAAACITVIVLWPGLIERVGDRILPWSRIRRHQPSFALKALIVLLIAAAAYEWVTLLS